MALLLDRNQSRLFKDCLPALQFLEKAKNPANNYLCFPSLQAALACITGVTLGQKLSHFSVIFECLFYGLKALSPAPVKSVEQEEKERKLFGSFSTQNNSHTIYLLAPLMFFYLSFCKFSLVSDNLVSNSEHPISRGL